MKNILIVVFILISVLSKAQPIFIYSVTPSYICQGDSLLVKFAWDNVQGSTIFSLSTNPSTTWNIPNNTFYGLYKTMFGVDTVYWLRLKVPISVVNGVYQFNAKYFMGQSNSKPVNVTCNPVGLLKHLLNYDPEAQYFDLYGNEIEKGINIPMIEKRGNNSRKIIIQE